MDPTWVRRRALRLNHRAWRFGAAPGPIDPVASEEGEGSPPAYDMAAQATPCRHVGVPAVEHLQYASGKSVKGCKWRGCTELRSEHLREDFIRAHHATTPPSSTASDVPHTPWINPLRNATMQRWLVAVAMHADAEMQRDLGLRDADNRMRLNSVHKRDEHPQRASSTEYRVFSSGRHTRTRIREGEHQVEP